MKRKATSQERKNKQRDTALRRTYGITAKEYDDILQRHDGRCWICRRPPKTKRLSVDHKHKRGERRGPIEQIRARVRGLLCWACNSGLQKFRDNPAFLRTAAKYLETWPAQIVLKCIDN